MLQGSPFEGSITGELTWTKESFLGTWQRNRVDSSSNHEANFGTGKGLGNDNYP